jgi:hypothetical protein
MKQQNNLPGSPSPERVATAISDWLQSEVRHADSGTNAFLSNYPLERRCLSMAFDDENNLMTQKARSHYRRRIQWVDPASNEGLWENDWMTGRVLFASLMTLAGCYRTQDYLEAADAEDYVARRYEEVLRPAEILSAVRNELAKPETIELVEAAPNKRIAIVTDMTLEANERNIAYHRALSEWVASHPVDVGAMAAWEDQPVQDMLAAESMWTGTTVAQMVVAASFRDDDYSRVPVLEPKSITDVSKVIYPLAV